MIEIGYMFLIKSDIWTLCKYESYFVSYKFRGTKIVCSRWRYPGLKDIYKYI